MLYPIELWVQPKSDKNYVAIARGASDYSERGRLVRDFRELRISEEEPRNTRSTRKANPVQKQTHWKLFRVFCGFLFPSANLQVCGVSAL